MEIYKYNTETKQLDEQPEMKEPHFMDYANLKDAQKRYQFELSEYKIHIASLKTYPISGIVPESWKGKELVEGRDFELKNQHNYYSQANQNIDNPIYGYTEIFAIPIQQPKEESQQDEYWEEIFDIVNSPLDNQQLKNKFFIQRININKNDIE